MIKTSSSRLHLIADASSPPPATAVVVRRFRLARLRLEGPPKGGAGRPLAAKPL